MSESAAEFGVGELVYHRSFGYRGVVVDVDPMFDLDDEWYDKMAKSRPPRDRPWYHVLVHDALHMTYVAERNLERDEEGGPVRHPLVDEYFAEFSDGRYQPAVRMN